MPENVFNQLKNLELYKNAKTAIVTDVDGTLSEIVPKPDNALIDSEMREILKLLENKFKLMVFISGRTIENVRKMVDIPGALYIGNHGMEYQKDGKIELDPDALQYKTEIGEIEKNLRKKLNLPGVILENKKTGLTVHYRLNEHQEMARISILNEISQLVISKGLMISEGKKIIEIKPLNANNKGTIIRRIVDDYKIDQMIYCGDDTTDIDAFNAIKSLNRKPSFKGASIVVLSKETSVNVVDSAQFYVNSIPVLKSFLYWLLDKNY